MLWWSPGSITRWGGREKEKHYSGKSTYTEMGWQTCAHLFSSSENLSKENEHNLKYIYDTCYRPQTMCAFSSPCYISPKHSCSSGSLGQFIQFYYICILLWVWQKLINNSFSEFQLRMNKKWYNQSAKVFFCDDNNGYKDANLEYNHLSKYHYNIIQL